MLKEQAEKERRRIGKGMEGKTRGNEAAALEIVYCYWDGIALLSAVSVGVDSGSICCHDGPTAQIGFQDACHFTATHVPFGPNESSDLAIV